ncbi:MAG: tRNA dihydrouridine synthase DusB [Hydrogenovibrio sp.]|uniref:tRNA dihydrouridine synthase DusB n=1 Tax=Hydrogenovibrio sp. TaxID=2065821 RepID=UPI00286FC390|nr:tRNA dihydrouridine synthase DusB [Hydrogenovibrio sp.]MDR9498136.1 tRNA dihydrouridine synthase DusB [Hydrogenovibrio sp.]
MSWPFAQTGPILALASMAGVTDRAMRDLCRSEGADYTVSEMVASKPGLEASRKSQTRHAQADETEPRIVQLLGTEPEELARAARFQVARGAQVIDLNMGCPAKKVCAVAAGSALMADPGRVAAIFDALVAAVSVPVTVKLRTGVRTDQRNAVEIAQLAEACGLQAVAVHGRTRADRFQGQAEYDTIRQVKQAITLPVMANGDICTPKQAQDVLKYTDADGLLIGRAAQGYPWIFREIRHFLNTGETLPPPGTETFRQVMRRHIQALIPLYGELQAARIARKHIGWYSRHLPQGTQLRQAFNRLDQTDQQLELIDRFLT